MRSILIVLFVLFLPVFSSAQTSETPTATAEIEVNLPIPDTGAILLSSINIPGSGLIDEIQIALRIQHDAVHELRISITSPTGLTTLLHNQTPSAQNPFNPVYESVTPSAGSLTVFQNINAQGTWTLSIEDSTRGNSGTLEAWGISLSPARLLDPAPPTPVPILPGTEFTTASAFIPNVSISGIQCADVNQDGLDDVLIFSDSDQSISIYTSNGTDLNPPEILLVPHPRLVKVSDLNSDGNHDLVVASDLVTGESSQVTVFINTPEGGYSKGFTAEIQTGLRTLSVLDQNNDSIPDILVGGAPFLLLGVGDGSFQPPQSLVFFGRDFFASADLNRDSFEDIFVSISRGGTSTNNDPYVILLDGDNPSQFQSKNGTLVNLDGSFLQSGVAATREPGDDEFVVLSQTQETEPVQLLTTIRNSISGQIVTEQSRLAPNTIQTPYTTFDINGDGLDEFVFVTSEGISSFQKNPDILGGDSSILLTDTTIQQVCAGLFFEDGSVGLAAITSNNEVILLESNLGERPTPPQFITPTPTPTSALFITPTPAPPTPTPQNTPTPTPGLFGNPDLNGDGVVNKLDLLLLIQSWGNSSN